MGKIAALALYAVFGRAAPASAQPDYNHDCTSSFTDSLAFMSDFAAVRPAADVNLDGRVDQTDFDAFSDSRAKSQFGYYWQVSTTLEPGRYMDTRTNLAGVPVSRNCVIFYEQEFPKIPIIYDVEDSERLHPIETGFHIVFRGVLGSYAGWRLNHDAWMSEHFASLASVIATRCPSPAYDGLLCLDWETVLPLYRVQTHNQAQIDLWDAMMEEINTPAIDPGLTSWAEWTPPAGARAWSDLTTEQKREFAGAVHIKVGLEFFVQSAEAVRVLRPQAKIHFYGLPQGIWPFYEAVHSGYNDQLASLWRVVDVLSPSTYQLYYTTTDPASSPCPDAVNTPGVNSNYFRTLLDEMYRLKQTYPRSGQQIVTYCWWHYKAQAGQCSPDINPTLLVNDTNLLQQLQLPWWYGADAVAIWGHYRRNAEVTPDYIGNDVQARWKTIMSRMTCPR